MRISDPSLALVAQKSEADLPGVTGFALAHLYERARCIPFTTMVPVMRLSTCLASWPHVGMQWACGLSLGEVRSPVLLLLPLLLGTAVLGQNAPSAPSDGLEGGTIAQIDFDPPNQPLPRDELERLLPIKVGQPLRRDLARAALQALYDTGRFEDASIDTEPLNGGVRIRISTTARFFVGSVSVDGEADPPNRNQLVTASKLELGTPFALIDADRARENMLERLRANGLFQANVDYQIDRTTATEEAHVHFHVESGKRSRFRAPQVKGKVSRPQESIVRSTRWHRGLGPIQLPGWRQVTENRVQTGLDRIRRSFQSDNRLQVRVTLDDIGYDGKTNTVHPTLTIDSGPVIDVQIKGASVSRGRLRQLIPIFEERSIDRSLLLEGNRNLVDYFQSKGYFDAEADFMQSEEQGGVQGIDYLVTLNLRHKLVAIEIIGNHFFDQGTIRERLTLREAGRLRLRYGRYSQKIRDQDRDAIRDLYRSNGFRDVMLTASTMDDYHGRHDELGVRFEIQEGEQWFVESLEWEGASASDTEYLSSIIQSSQGQPFSETGLAADRDLILAYFLNNGYPNAAFDFSQSPGSLANRVRLRYTVRPGERQFVRDVLVRGLNITRQNLVTNRIQLHPGDPVSQSRIYNSQQKLYDLGIFARAQTALQNPDGKEESKYVLFQVDEAARYSFTAAFGAELGRIGGGVTTFDSPGGVTGFSPRVSLGITRLNFLGLAHSVTLQGLVSSYEQRAVTSYFIPQFVGNENLALTISGQFDTSRDVRTFAARRWEGSLQFTQRLSRANSVQYRYTFRRATIDESTLKISPELIPLLSQPVRVGLVSTTFIQDRRDNPADSHRGVYNTVDLGLATAALGSVTDYSRILLRNSTYHRVGRELVIARTLQFGYIQRLGGLPEIPLSERFYAGGASSNRAFPDNQSGPRDPITGFPIGGTALFFHMTEFRFPLFSENIGGVLFHDMGNTFDSISDVSFRFRQRDIQDFNYTVHGFGIGIRYRTPVGPIRVDFSFSPNSPRFRGFTGTRDELLSIPPNPPPEVIQQYTSNQRINQFQFHFSLGQTF
jgi:outer membrane protein insertion porin family